MGMLDFVPLKEFKPKNTEGSVSLTCDRCGNNFMGQPWMLKAKKEITCPQCWRYDRLDEEADNQAGGNFDDLF